jgi:hypothetical protein
LEEDLVSLLICKVLALEMETGIPDDDNWEEAEPENMFWLKVFLDAVKNIVDVLLSKFSVSVVDGINSKRSLRSQGLDEHLLRFVLQSHLEFLEKISDSVTHRIRYGGAQT